MVDWRWCHKPAVQVVVKLKKNSKLDDNLSLEVTSRLAWNYIADRS